MPVDGEKLIVYSHVFLVYGELGAEVLCGFCASNAK